MARCIWSRVTFFFCFLNVFVLCIAYVALSGCAYVKYQWPRYESLRIVQKNFKRILRIVFKIVFCFNSAFCFFFFERNAHDWIFLFVIQSCLILLLHTQNSMFIFSFPHANSFFFHRQQSNPTKKHKRSLRLLVRVAYTWYQML